MPAALFQEWQVYAAIEPFGEPRADLRMAQVCALLANINRDRKQRPQPYTIRDFMFEFDREPEPEETKLERQLAAGRMIASAVGGIWRSGKNAE